MTHSKIAPDPIQRKLVGMPRSLWERMIAHKEQTGIPMVVFMRRTLARALDEEERKFAQTELPD